VRRIPLDAAAKSIWAEADKASRRLKTIFTEIRAAAAPVRELKEPAPGWRFA
jgi:hypothetical protein